MRVTVGLNDAVADGDDDGPGEGPLVGEADGHPEGSDDGTLLGIAVEVVGMDDGVTEGVCDCCTLGISLGCDVSIAGMVNGKGVAEATEKDCRRGRLIALGMECCLDLGHCLAGR